MHSPAEVLRPVAPHIGRMRILAGLAQGLVLYLLYLAAKEMAWPATEPFLFAPLLLVALACPVLLISGAAHMDRRQLLAWVGTAAAIIVALAVYDIWRMPPRLDGAAPARTVPPSAALNAFVAIGLFIAHSLVLAGAREGRRIASYDAYFDSGWKLGVQLGFSGLFVGVTWLALHLGAGLFELVKIDFFEQLIKESWFAIPVTAFAFSSAMHLTDVRPAIVQGIRGLLLTLLSWILPVFTLIVAGFLASLPFTGLEPLWATRSAAMVLFGADVALIVLINAAWQNGAAAVAGVVRASARVAALLLVPVTALAVYALALRVGEHGWTVDRIVAAACMFVASAYALGYAAAALRPGWLQLVAPVNIANAFLVLGVALLLFSPLADPARLAVDHQLARLAAGKVTAAQFDVAFLRFDGQRYGHAAMARLEAQASGPEATDLRARIAEVRKLSGRGRHREEIAAPAPAVLAANLRVWPAGTRLPDSFLRHDWSRRNGGIYHPDCLRHADRHCDTYLLDLNRDGKQEVVVVDPGGLATVFQEAGAARWQSLGRVFIPPTHCKEVERLRAEGLRAAAPDLDDIEIGGRRFRVRPGETAYVPCETAAQAP